MVIVELTTFKKSAKKLLSQDSIDDLKIFLSDNPTAGVVIQHTGGLRKLRWSLNNGNGKSGGSRVIYYYCDDNNPLYLFDCYAKNVKEDLTDNEKKELSSILKLIKKR